MSTTILIIIGLLVFFAHFLSLQFPRTNIPDVLVLMLFGILIGSLLGVVVADDFGKIGSLIATLALVVILFESGISLDLNVLGKVRDFPNTISSTLAYVFIVYGATEGLGFPGAIAALSLGITLTNFEKFGLHRIQQLDRRLEPLNQMDITFYREAVFLLKTYFFIYLGISIHFGAATIALAAISMVLLIYALRLLLTRFIFRSAEFDLRDTALTAIMVPKGLAAAVLASLPLSYGVAGGRRNDTRRDLYGGAGQHHPDRLAGDRLSRANDAAPVRAHPWQNPTAQSLK